MLRSANDTSRIAAVYPYQRTRAGAGPLAPGRATPWGSIRRQVTFGILMLLIVGLAGLGSYDLEASKPRMPDPPVERICPHRFKVGGGHTPIEISVCLNLPSLEASSTQVTHAIVVVHGNGRNAASSEATVEGLVRSAERADVLVVAPQFLTPLDLEAQAAPPDVATWRRSTWSQGNRAVAANGTERPGAFDVVDKIVEAISRPGRYPNLADITIVGHSAGGQFVQRYAAGTRIEHEPTVEARHLAFHYVAANPSSYLYLFPRKQDALTERCPAFDEYKYGLGGLNEYLRPLGPEGMRANYAQKDVTLLLGRLDHELLDPLKDDSCAARVQGTHRVNRGIRFVQQLDQQYGIGQHRTRLVMVPDVGHNGRAMFTSSEGRAALLGH